MQVNSYVHKIEIKFNVTPQIERFVNVYLIVGKQGNYLIDTGVAGAEEIIAAYMKKIGSSMASIKKVFLTHSHPDHIGSAAVIKEIAKCKVYGAKAEQEWMEDVEKQFYERPIPNFHHLVNQSVILDEVLIGGESIELEPDLTLQIMNTPGHSEGSLSFYLKEEEILFTGDAIPIVGDIPIYVNYKASVQTLEQISKIDHVSKYCSAWSEVWNVEDGKRYMQKAKKMLANIYENVKEVIRIKPEVDEEELFLLVCKKMKLEKLAVNPLFKTSILATRRDLYV